MAKWCHLSYSACTLSDLGMWHCHIHKAHHPTTLPLFPQLEARCTKVTPALAAIIIIIDPDTLPWALPDSCMQEILAFLSTLSEHSSPVESLPPKREEEVGDYYVHYKVSGIVFPAFTGTVFGGNFRIRNRWHTQQCWPHYLTAAMHFKIGMSCPNYNCLKCHLHTFAYLPRYSFPWWLNLSQPTWCKKIELNYLHIEQQVLGETAARGYVITVSPRRLRLHAPKLHRGTWCCEKWYTFKHVKNAALEPTPVNNSRVSTVSGSRRQASGGFESIWV